MGFFSRLANVWNGFLSLFVGSLEEKNPAAVYEAAIQERLKTHAELKKAIGNIMFLRNKTQAEFDKLQQELERTDQELEGALATDDNEMAVILIEKQEQLQNSLAAKEKELQRISKNAEDSKGQLQQFQVEINKLKSEKDEKLAQLANAEAQIKIQESLNGLSVDADIQALNNVREAIGKKVGQAEIDTELADSSLDRKLDKLREKGAQSRAQAKLEQLKQARAGGVVQTAQPTTAAKTGVELSKGAPQPTAEKNI